MQLLFLNRGVSLLTGIAQCVHISDFACLHVTLCVDVHISYYPLYVVWLYMWCCFCVCGTCVCCIQRSGSTRYYQPSKYPSLPQISSQSTRIPLPRAPAPPPPKPTSHLPHLPSKQKRHLSPPTSRLVSPFTHTHTSTHSHIHCIYRIAIKFGELALSRYWRTLNLAIWTLSAIGTHTIINIDEF